MQNADWLRWTLEMTLSWETESDDRPYIFNGMKALKKFYKLIALNKKISFRDLTL